MRARNDPLVSPIAAFTAAIFASALAAALDDKRALAGEAAAPAAGKPMLDIDTEPMKSSAEELNRFDGKPYKIYPDGEVNFATYRGLNL